ncbi:MAG: DNA repair protein RadC [Armatimonadetes bacterium]|nr:DNA repair protein RadC [Armatimonadota bacterium]
MNTSERQRRIPADPSRETRREREEERPPAGTSPTYALLIRDLPADERPRERLIRYGPEALSAAELIAILLRTGAAGIGALDLGRQLVSRFGSLRGVAQASVEALAQVKGLGPAKAAQLKAAFELGKRNAVFVDAPRPQIGSPQDVARLLMPELAGELREQLRALFLDTRNQVLRARTISIGGLDASIIHPREVFKEAIAQSAAAVIVAHNHPSGDPSPSPEDIAVTRRLVEAGRIIGIELLDHVVIGDGRFVSLKERGLM